MLMLFVFLSLKLMLPLAAASATSQLPLAVLLLAVVGWQGQHGGQLCRRHRCWCCCYAHAVFFVFRLFLFVCRVAARLHLPPQFRRRHLQDLVHLFREHTKIMMAREFTFSSRRKLNFPRNFLANTPFVHIKKITYDSLDSLVPFFCQSLPYTAPSSFFVRILEQLQSLHSLHSLHHFAGSSLH